MSPTDPTTEEPLVFGVPGRQLVDALRAAGLADDAVVSLLGQAIARSAGISAAAADDEGFHFQTQIAETAPDCVATYNRLFTHTDFVDGVTVVQAGATPDEEGFNARFHSIEAELDAISIDLHTGSNCLAELRRELFSMVQELEVKITDIDRRIRAKGKDKDTKDTKEKEKDTKEKEKDTKEKDTKEGKDKEHKDGKEHKEGKDRIDKVVGVEKLVGVERQPALPPSGPVAAPGESDAADEEEPAPDDGTERTFIRLEDRPPVGEDALAEPDQQDE